MLKIIIIIAVSSFFTSQINGQEYKTTELRDFDGFSNKEYAAWLANDGWPVEKLNTGAEADYLNDEEKNLILAMNLIRYNPEKYSTLYVFPRLQYFQGTAFHFPGRIPLRTREGIEAVRELYLELLETEPMPLFYPSKGMSKASADHARYMRRTATASHEGGGGLGARVSRHGQWVSGLAENLAWATTNAHETIVNLMIDDGIRNRGHRKNILNPAYNKVGVAIDDHPRFTISWVINYAVDFIEKE